MTTSADLGPKEYAEMKRASPVAVEGTESVVTTELDRPVTVVSPRTGEVLTLDAPTDDLAGVLADVREQQDLLREMKAVVDRELLARLDRDGRWTAHTARFTVEGDSPAPGVEYDALALRSALQELVDEGVLSVEAVDHAVEMVVTYKPRVAGLNALRKLGGRVADLVDAHSRVVERRRGVRIKARKGA